MRPPPSRSVRSATIEVLEGRIAPATFLVTSGGDSGAGTLRQAILDANSAPGVDLIAFDLPAGQTMIQPLTQLPVINGSLIIDGYTQPGSLENTDAFGSNAVLKVRLDGTLLSSGNGLVFGGGGGSVVRGLSITGFHPAINDSGNAIALKSSNNIVSGNYIGVDLIGNSSPSTANTNAGVRVGDFNSNAVTFTDNVVGGTNRADRNVIGGNTFGVAVEVEAQGTQILGNLIGTDPTGTLPRANNQAGIVNIGTGTMIGDGTAAGRNVISGNIGSGISVGIGPGLEVRGNFIGTTVTGNAPLPNFRGILAQNLAEGGVIDGNVISGNSDVGISLGSPFGDGDAHNFVVRGNLIGVSATGGLPLGNGGAGVVLQNEAYGNIIGGENPGEGNTIAFNDGAGILRTGTRLPNRFLGNSIQSNTALGIDVAGASNFFGVTPNDASDKDGATNFPVIVDFTNTGAAVTLSGTYKAAAGLTYRLEFFAVAPNQIDLSGHGEGTVFLGFVEVTTDAAGTANFNFNQPVSLPADTAFTATATETKSGRTSEFGPAKGKATSYQWNGVTGDWFTPTNWTPNGIPGPLDTVVLSATGVALVLNSPVGVHTFRQTGNMLAGASELNILNSWNWTGGSHLDPDGTIRLIEGATGIASSGVWAAGTLEIRGSVSVENAGLLFNSGAMRIEFGGILTLNAGILDENGAATVAFVDNRGLIVKRGGGTFGFDGIRVNNNSGIVLASEGTFRIGRLDSFDGSVELAGGNLLTTDRFNLFGGEFTGSGTVGGRLVGDGGVIRPGGDGSVGVMNFTGDLDVLLGAKLSVDIAGLAPGTQHDQVIVSGTATLAGTLEHRILGGFVVRVDDDFLVLDAATRNGTFGTVSALRPLAVQYSGGDVTLAATGFIVTNTDDSGSGSLRDAILAANAQPGLDYISFNIPGGGLKTITPLTLLPAITDPVAIDGYSQPGAAVNSLSLGSDAVLLIEINGQNIPNVAGTEYGIRVNSGGSYISGLVINRVRGYGIMLSGSGGNIVAGNWIGTDATGAAAPVNSQFGILVDDSANNRIGSALPRDRNVISGNNGNGIEIIAASAPGNIIQGNYIGTTKTGVALLGNGFDGVYTQGATTQIGGEKPGEGNVISGSLNSVGILINLASASGSIVLGNLIGTDATGTLDFGNADIGIEVVGTPNVIIGGEFAGARNVIAGNGFAGISIEGSSNAQVLGNFIGTDVTGTQAIGNDSGIYIGGSSGAQVGDVGPGFGNVIAFNTGHGVVVETAGQSSSGNSIRGNSIFSNGTLGINLMVAGDPASGITANDALDVDVGPNGLLNFPVLTTFAAGTLSGTYQGLANTTFTLDFYSSSAADSSGNGEGQSYIGTIFVITDSSGNAGFNIPIVSGNSFVTATATRTGTGDTSEFSNAFSIVAPLVYVWDNDSGDGDWFKAINWDLNSGVPGPLDTAVLSIPSTITIGNGVTVANFVQSAGTVNGTGNMTITNSFTWSGGVQAGAATLFIGSSAIATLSGTSTKTLDRRSVQNDGSLRVTGSGALQYQNGPQIINAGTFDFQTDADLVALDVTGAAFTNSGTLKKSSGPGISTLGGSGAVLAIVNSGTIAVASGTLELAGSGGNWLGATPIVDVSAGATLQFSSGNTSVNAPALSGSGRILISGGALSIAGSVTVPTGLTLELAGGDLPGTGSLKVDGTFKWSAGTLGPLGGTTINSGGTFDLGPDAGQKTITSNFTNNGTGTVNAGLTIINGASFTNGGTLEFISDVTWGRTGGPALVNTGTMMKTGGAGDFIFGGALAVANSGMIESRTGRFNFAIGYTQTAGTLFLNGGNVTGLLTLIGGELTGTGVVDGPLNNTGAVVRPGGTGATGSITFTSSFTQGPGGTYEFEAKNEGHDSVLVTGTTVLGGTLDISFINGYRPPVGTEIRALQSVGTPTGSFTTLTGDTTGIEQQVDNAGIEVARIAATFTWDGGGGADTSWFNELNWNFDSGIPSAGDTAILNSARTINIGQLVTVATFIQTSGVVTGAASLDITNAFTWSGGAQSGGGTTTLHVGGTMTLDSGGHTLNRPILNNGTANWTAGDVTGSGTFTNNGTFAATSGATFAAPFANAASGTLNQTSGTNTFTDTPTNAGVVDIKGGLVRFNAGLVQSAGAITLTGGSVFTTGFMLNGGEIAGSGTITGAVINFSGTIRPGAQNGLGTLTITGNYTQSAFGTLSTELAGTAPGQFDVLVVGGTANLGGTLSAPLLGGFTPPANSQFLVLTSGGLINSFATPPGNVGIQYAGANVILLGPVPPVDSIVTTELDVVNANDGVVSLREAINFANSNPGLDTISFNIPGAGLHSIRPSSGLPIITDPIIINGYSQPGSSPSTGGPGQADNAVRLIEISGITIASGFPNGLHITAGGSTVEGLILKRWRGSQLVLETGGGNVISGNLIGEDIDPSNLSANGHGIAIINSPGNIIGGTDPADRNRITGNVGSGVFIIGESATGNTVLGNFIGTNAAGNGGFGNGNHGVQIGADNNTVGGTSAGARNLISGNSDGFGVYISGGNGNVVLGNFIGTDITGTGVVRNLFGVGVFNGANNIIGGAAGNVISGNFSQGVSLTSGATGNRIEGNFIGTDVTGTQPLGNTGHGVLIAGTARNNTIGGSTSAASNVIGANGGAGISVFSDSPGATNTIKGNFIGTDVTGIFDFGNSGGGIDVNAAQSLLIGGTSGADRNVIAFNAGAGISVHSDARGVSILGNSIYSNGPGGIDLDGDGFTPNDAGDIDVGGNELQNFPTLTTVTPHPGGTTIAGSLISTPDTTLRIEFFRTDSVDANGVGQGKTFIGFVNVGTNGAGLATFSADVAPVLASGALVTATATSSFNQTSEFALAVAAPSTELIVTTTLDVVDPLDGEVSLREAIQFANNVAGVNTITFNIPGGGVKTISLTSALPEITEAVIIDGYSQPGSVMNELLFGIDAAPLIVLDGSGAGFGADGLWITGGDSVVTGLVIGGFNGAGIRINNGGHNVIAGNFIGTDATGTAAFGNTTGIFVTSSDNTIGRLDRGSRNLISGNSSLSGALEAGAGIVISGSSARSNIIQNNYVGTDATGTVALANSKSGVAFYGGPSGNTIGGGDFRARNIVSGNSGHGVDIAFSSDDNKIFGNYIGLVADGTSALGNAGGGVLINFDSRDNIIGDSIAGYGNVIAANAQGGIALAVNVSNTIVDGNRLGTTADGLTVLGNGLYSVVLGGAGTGNIIGTPGGGNLIAKGQEDAIRIENGSSFAIVQGNTIGIAADGTPFGEGGRAIGIFASNNTIGGFGAGEGNIIANNDLGVVVGSGTGNRIIGNEFLDGIDMSIDLGNDEEDVNDIGDVDGGPNLHQNYPVLSGVNIIGTSLGVIGRLDTLPGSYTIQLYRSTTTASGHGLGTPFGTFSLTVNSGATNFAETIVGAGVGVDEFVSAIVINDVTGDTSEFSLAVAALPAVPVTIDKQTPFSFTDASGDQIKVTLKGKGSINLILRGGAIDNADLDLLELIDTDLTSKLSVTIVSPNPAGTNVSRISTVGTIQHVGSILLGKLVSLGDGVADNAADLRVSGKMNVLFLDDIAPNTIIQLGEGLPYDLPGTKDPDSLNNRPTLTIGDVLGSGVQINVMNNGISGPQGGIGGGGFGNVTINSWSFNGFLRTTQSIGNFFVRTGDFFAVLEIDKLHHGEGTQADVGAMTIADGAWGSSGTEIEGYVTAFNAEAFLAGASIVAGNIGSIKMQSANGGFAGTLILTDPNAPSIPTFTVNSNFSGRVVSANSIKKLNIKGDFTGSLEAPSIGAITAFRFLGAADTDITATLGGIGLLKSTAGVFRDYDIVTPSAFSGITVKLGKLTTNTAGIDNVHVTAASIGNITVSLAASKSSTGVNLTGINNSDFITTSTGNSSKTSGKIGKVSVTVSGAGNGNGVGISDAVFDARVVAGEFDANPPSAVSTINSLGNISVKVSGFGGDSIGVDQARFEGDTTGSMKVLVFRGKLATATGFGVRDVNLTSTSSIGALTVDGDVTANQVTELSAYAGTSIGAVNIKAKNAALGTLAGSTLLAGQSLSLGGADKELKAALSAAALGPVSASGAITGTLIAAGATVRGVTAGGEMSDSLVLAGAMLGADRGVGGGDDSYQRAAGIAAITVKGAFTRTSIAAGINPGNAVFGDGDDIVAATAGTLTTNATIGAITLALAGSPQNAGAMHNHAIEAASIKSLKTIAGIIKDFAVPAYLDAGAAGEDADDVLIRVL